MMLLKVNAESAPKLKEAGGFLFPYDDEKCHGAMLRESPEIDSRWMQHVKGRQVCVQAGGNCGVYPLRLAAHFATVYTFEPDALNFECMRMNCRATNVVMRQVALGERAAMTDLVRSLNNCGAHYMSGEGDIPVLSIDSLNLPACDLIALDIEGAELPALKGAERTIQRCRPAIIVEEKRHCERFGYTLAELDNWLIAHGYRKADKSFRDVIWTPI